MNNPLPFVRIERPLCVVAWLAAASIACAQPSPKPASEQAPAAALPASQSLSVNPVTELPPLAKPPETQKYDVRPWQTPPLNLDLANGFAGLSNGALIVAGADRSAASGSDLSVWTIPIDAGSQAVWQPAGLTVPSEAATAQWGDSVASVGGISGGKLVPRAMLIGMRDGKRPSRNCLRCRSRWPGRARVWWARRFTSRAVFPPVRRWCWRTASGRSTSGPPDAAWTRETPLPGPGRAFAAVA